MKDFVIACFAALSILVLAITITGILFGLLRGTYEYKTENGSFGESPSCWKDYGRLVCERKDGLVEVTEYERKN